MSFHIICYYVGLFSSQNTNVYMRFLLILCISFSIARFTCRMSQGRFPRHFTISNAGDTMVLLGNRLLKYNETKICDRNNVFFFLKLRILQHTFLHMILFTNRHGNRVNDIFRVEFSRKRMTPKFAPLTVIFASSQKHNSCAIILLTTR